MSIAQFTNKKQDLTKAFGENQGIWEYYDYDGNFICWTVRTKYFDDEGKEHKQVKPWTIQNGRLTNKFHPDIKTKPIYNLHWLKKHPEKTVLIVEGEKTADAATKLFPEYVCISWMGGCKAVGKVILDPLSARKCILIPDNDENGYKAMEFLYIALRRNGQDIAFIDTKSLGVFNGWDVENLYDEHAEIESEDVFELVRNTKFNNREILLTLPIIESSSFPLLTQQGKPMNAYENLDFLFNFYSIDASFDLIKKKIIINIPHKKFTNTNKEKLDLAEITSLCIKNNMPRPDIIAWLTMIADKNSFNPVEQFITSKPWDGMSRIKEFMETIDCVDNKLRDIYIYRWMIGAVAIALAQKPMAHPGVLTFIGKQSKGKSAWVSKLVPEELNLILGEFILNPDDKDSVIRATKYWIVELAEADATVNKSESNAQKAFLTRKTDLYRAPYDKADTEAPRHTCFIGTVNEAQFLKDTSGNRRWWVLEVNHINYEHTLDMQQVWAEFKVLLEKGEQYHLSKSEYELLMNQNEEYVPSSSIEEAIRINFKWDQNYQYVRLTALQVLEKCGFEIKNTNKNHLSKEANRVLRILCKEKARRIDGLFYYLLPEPIEVEFQFKRTE